MKARYGNLKEQIINWIVPFLLGSAASFIGSMFIKLKAIKNGIQCLLRAEIIRSNEKYKEKGFCPIYAKEALTRAYKAYHALKGNDVATGLYEETMNLPNDHPALNEGASK